MTQPLVAQIPIVDPDTGVPTTYFIQMWQSSAVPQNLIVTSDASVFKYDSFNNPVPDPQTITFTAIKTNASGTVQWSLTDSSGNALTASSYLSSTEGDTTTMTNTQFQNAIAQHNTNGVTVVGTLVFSGVSYSDGVKITKLADGNEGTPGQGGYVHLAYSTSADGSQNFSTNDATNKTYLGTYTDNIQADSQDYTKYTWALFKGPKGDSGSPGVSPAPAYPAFAIDGPGTFQYINNGKLGPIPVQNGKTLKLYGTLSFAVTAGSATVTVDVQYSLDGGTSWTSGGVSTTNAFVNEPSQSAVLYNYTNNTGSDQTIDFQVVVSKGGVNSVSYNSGYGQAGG